MDRVCSPQVSLRSSDDFDFCPHDHRPAVALASFRSLFQKAALLLRETALLIFLQFGDKASASQAAKLALHSRRCLRSSQLERQGFLQAAHAAHSRQACHAGSGALMLLLDSRDPLARPWPRGETRHGRAFVYTVVASSLAMTWRLVPKWARGLKARQRSLDLRCPAFDSESSTT